MPDRDNRYRRQYLDIVDLEAKARGDVRDSSSQPAKVTGRSVTNSAAWWLGELLDEMPAKQTFHQALWDYYEGRHPLPWLHDLDLVPHFDRLQRISRTNFLALVLEAVEERLDVEGFRVGSSIANEERLWELWQINDLDELSQLANTMAFVTGTSYSLSWVGDDGDGEPQSWVEDSMQVHHRWDLARPRAREVRAAVKVWDNGDGRDRADLYLPDGIYRYQRPHTTTGVGGTWEPEENEAYEKLPRQFREVWPDGIVPVTPLIVRPDRLRRGRSELIESIPIQDRINQTIFDRLVGQSYASFQQVVGIGVQPEQDENGQQVNPLKRNPARTWLIEAGGKIETIDPQSLQQMLDAHEQDVNAMARISRTPPNYLSTKMQFPSGDAVRGSDAGLAKKAHRRTRSLGGGYERNARILAAADGQFDIARDRTLETQWANVEVLNNSQLMDELVKARAGLQVPVEALWERWGATSTEIANWRKQRNLELVLGGMQEVRSAEQPELPGIEVEAGAA